jgi:hypothetical protein
MKRNQKKGSKDTDFISCYRILSDKTPKYGLKIMNVLFPLQISLQLLTHTTYSIAQSAVRHISKTNGEERKRKKIFVKKNDCSST